MSDDQQKLSLNQPTLYQIKVLGLPGKNWSDWAGELTISASGDEDLPVTELTGALIRLPYWDYCAASILWVCR